MRVQLVNVCMHVSIVFQITEYSLMDNSCMSVQSETQLRSDGGTMYYQLLGYSLVNIPCMQKDLYPRESQCYFFLFSECDGVNSHMWLHWTPRKIVQRNKGLEDLRRIYTCLLSL